MPNLIVVHPQETVSHKVASHTKGLVPGIVFLKRAVSTDSLNSMAVDLAAFLAYLRICETSQHHNPRKSV